MTQMCVSSLVVAVVMAVTAPTLAQRRPWTVELLNPSAAQALCAATDEPICGEISGSALKRWPARRGLVMVTDGCTIIGASVVGAAVEATVTADALTLDARLKTVSSRQMAHDRKKAKSTWWWKTVVSD